MLDVIDQRSSSEVLSVDDAAAADADARAFASAVSDLLAGGRDRDVRGLGASRDKRCYRRRRVDALHRLLELVARELAADDVRIEVGLRAPEPRHAWCELAGGYRLIAVFDTAPADLDERRARLEVLAQTFAATLSSGLADAPQLATGTELAAHALDETLAALARIAAATAAVVIDDHSPMIWGSSLVPRGPEDADVAAWMSAAALAASRHGLDLAALLANPAEVDAALNGVTIDADNRTRIVRALGRLHAVGLARTPGQWRDFVLVMRAIASSRRGPADAKQIASTVEGRPDSLGWMSRGFGGIYRVVLVFDGSFSELHAEAALIRALPVVEKHVIGLPPVDPSPGGGGHVVRMFGPR